MWKTIIRRTIILIPQLFVLSLVVFLLAMFMPGDVLTGLIDPELTWEDVQHIRAELGLDRPWPVRYVEWVGGMFTGDFGRSWTHQRPVIEVIGERAPNTFRLSLLTAIFTYLISVPMGLLAGRYRETLLDKSIVIYTFTTLAIPTIIMALLMLFIFGFWLRWVPIQGSVDVRLVTGSLDYWVSRLHHLILPALTGALLGTVGIVNVLRSEIIDYENSDFVTTARSKGVPRRRVYTRHIFRNACLPLASSIAFVITGLLGGAIFIERVFSFPGMGNLFITSIMQRDFSVANILVLMFGFLTILGTLLADIIMTVVDPRIRIK